MEITIEVTDAQKEKLKSLMSEIHSEYLEAVSFKPEVIKRGWWIFKIKGEDWTGEPELKHHYREVCLYNDSYYFLRNFHADVVCKVCYCLTLGSRVTLSPGEASALRQAMEGI